MEAADGWGSIGQFLYIGVLFCGCPSNESLLFGICIGAPDFWKLPTTQRLAYNALRAEIGTIQTEGSYTFWF